MGTKSQHYSDLVFKNIERLKRDYEPANAKRVKRYKSLCKRAGGVMRTVGLIQFLTFLAAKATKDIHHQDLLDHLRQELNEAKIVQSKDSSELLTAIRRQPLPEYMQSTKETLRFLQWHKRISEILIEGTAEEEED